VTGRRRRRTVEIIADNPGLTSLQIIERLYAGDPDGGPDSLKIISVFVHHANKQLAKSGQKIVGSPGKGGGYKLIRL
jgi:hypothetical protein